MRRGTWLLIIILAVVAAAIAVRVALWKSRSQSENGQMPAAYSARVVRTVETASSRQVTESRVAKMNDMFREDWLELSESRSVIWRPDLGKVFLLLPEKQIYSETEIAAAAPAANRSIEPVDPDAIERFMPGRSTPAKIETLPIAPQTIEDHPCEGSERRLVFPSGHVEISRVFRARDLGGLPIRTETFSQGASGLPRVTVQLQEIDTDVSANQFNVPAGFTKALLPGIGSPPSGTTAWR